MRVHLVHDVSDPHTGKEWERVGVLPNIKTNPGDALTVAHLAAIDSLARLTADAAQRSSLATVRASVDANAHPRVVAAQTLASYAGTYEGGRVIALENGALTYRRDGSRPPRPMIAISDSAFVLNSAIRRRVRASRERRDAHGADTRGRIAVHDPAHRRRAW
jgi:hypothetical protein